MKTFIGVIGLAALLGGSPALAQPNDWRGFWAGVGVGGSVASWRQSSQSRSSVVGAAEVGFNWVFGQFLIGPVARVGINSDRWQGLQFRAGIRGGALVTPRLLLHAGAGVMNAGRTASLYYSSGGSPLVEVPFSAGRGWGLYAATGVEYRLDGPWSVGVDYAYTTTSGAWFGWPAPMIPVPGAPARFSVSTATHEFMAAIRYRF